jgi:hypothetical protein
MPHFYFHWKDHPGIHDREGEPWQTLQDAKSHADIVAEELGRNRSAREIKGHFIQVTDEDGEELYRAALTNKGR